MSYCKLASRLNAALLTITVCDQRSQGYLLATFSRSWPRCRELQFVRAVAPSRLCVGRAQPTGHDYGSWLPCRIAKRAAGIEPANLVGLPSPAHRAFTGRLRCCSGRPTGRSFGVTPCGASSTLRYCPITCRNMLRKQNYSAAAKRFRVVPVAETRSSKLPVPGTAGRPFRLAASRDRRQAAVGAGQ